MPEEPKFYFDDPELALKDAWDDENPGNAINSNFEFKTNWDWMSTFTELLNDWLNYDANALMNECLRKIEVW